MDPTKSWLVYQAVVALERFCKKYKVRFEMRDSLNFAIAYTGQTFEWTPCADGFRRIYATRPYGDEKQIATVFKGFETDEDSRNLTNELNQMIFEATEGEWRL